jgi:hypothetical protein
MPAWPGSLPQFPLVDGNNIALGDNRLVFKPDRGRTIMRRATTSRDDSASFTFSLSAAQVASFMSFYKTDCADGSLSFTYLDPTIGATKTFQFASPPAISYINQRRAKVVLSLTRLNS